MKRETAKWVHKAETDWEVAHKLAGETPPPRDVVCFHCQQASEKYLKALLQENGLACRFGNRMRTRTQSMEWSRMRLGAVVILACSTFIASTKAAPVQPDPIQPKNA